MPLAIFRDLPLSNTIVIASPRSLISVVIGGTCGVTAVVGVPILNVIRGVDDIVYPRYGGRFGVFNDNDRKVTRRLNIRLLNGVPVSIALTRLISGNYFRGCSGICLGTTTRGVSDGVGGGRWEVGGGRREVGGISTLPADLCHTFERAFFVVCCLLFVVWEDCLAGWIERPLFWWGEVGGGWREVGGISTLPAGLCHTFERAMVVLLCVLRCLRFCDLVLRGTCLGF